MSLSLAYRAARSSLLSNSTSRLSHAALPIRHASLSAINKGLVRSEQARPQGARADKLDDLAAGGKRMTYAERREARKQLAEERPAFKIRRGKKDITQYPDEPKAKSRRARFYDPESSFGKKSLVYQLKTGKLRDELRTLQENDHIDHSSESPFERTGPRPDLRPPPRRTVRKLARTRNSIKRDEDTGDVADFVAALSRSADSSRDTPRSDVALRRDAPSTRRNDAFGRGRDAAPRRDRDAGRDNAAPKSPPPQKTAAAAEPPLSITYTTAASQFLYGKSVVEAALRCARRQLYKLYIYGGANRQNRGDEALIRKLAERKGVPVAVLDGESGLRLLNKMSLSRPHNGFVLEASPLPQPPVTALGAIPDDYAGNPRYGVTLGHQSAEEIAVNGTPTTLPAPASSPSHRPLVLVLDRVVDPGNLGAILRTAAFLGAAAVGITRRGSAGLTPVALKASAGAAESLPLFSVGSLPEFVALSRDSGWSVYAAVARDSASAGKRQQAGRHVDLHGVEETDPLRREPCVLLVGNEGEGLERMIVKKADYEVNIPNMSAPGSGVDSLNVGVAVALLCSAFLKGATKEMEGFGIGLAQGASEGAGVKEILW
ncbi:hypothetical protein P885DRAFT_37553 [Corynascus similis CBS 632.67]